MLNRIIIQGNIATDPTNDRVRGSKGDDITKTRFRIAVNNQDTTTFFNVSLLGSRAEALIKHCKKGDQIIVDGEMSSFRNKENTEIYVINGRQFHFCGKKNN